MKRLPRTAALLGLLFVPVFGYARDFGVSVPSIHKGKFTSSVLYEHLKVRDDFDARGKADFRSHVVGSQFSYGLTDQMAVSLKGGALVDPEEKAQGKIWQGRAGYLYGFDLYHEVFPATGYWPGVQASAGVTGFLVPLSQMTGSTGTVTLVDQRITGLDYHGAVLLAMKSGRFAPYVGVRIYERTVGWHDNQPGPTDPANVGGSAHGNASLVLGVPVRISEAVQFQVEAMFVNQTAITAGLTIAVF
ncbi:MAG: hypothetical protein A2992_03695 [Elusimicrobia bacterium RIFCSPLOWO2_01_FULL_59_12]|nr:MAG: hypothetical protein A2992_03695 [Elusimicrobia bacterium RIFCSPLOWO2_01_FULL_59_12]